MRNFLEALNNSYQVGKLPEKVYTIFKQLYHSYVQALNNTEFDAGKRDELFFSILEQVEKQVDSPYPFSPYHSGIETPFNYYKLGQDFVRPLVDLSSSQIFHEKNIEKMQKQLKNQENVILFANHQTEVDPQLINTVLEEKYPAFAKQMIFVAGDRVLTDPMAAPFSMGRNLLCIYSKRHIDNPPEKKAEKLVHNQKTMQRMCQMLTNGSVMIYVAPAGGRDRPNKESVVEVSDFDPQSIEMFRLIAIKAKTATHFYPLALCTYDILPPPDDIQKEIGEMRKAKRNRVLLDFGDEIDMQSFENDAKIDHKQMRQIRCQAIFEMVKNAYLKMRSS